MEIEKTAGRAAGGAARKHGFTLIEVMLVLAVLVIMAGFAWAALAPMIAHQRLVSATDAVRSELARGKTDAIKSGQTYSFQYIVHGDHYRLGPKDAPAAPAPAASTAASDSKAADLPAQCGSDAEEESLPPAEECSLPSGVTFLPGTTSGDSAAGDSDDDAAQPSGGAEDTWSDPIYFYPDGSTSDAKVRLSGAHDSTLQLSLRGVTGTVTMGDAKSGS